MATKQRKPRKKYVRASWRISGSKSFIGSVKVLMFLAYGAVVDELDVIKQGNDGDVYWLECSLPGWRAERGADEMIGKMNEHRQAGKPQPFH